MANDDHARSTGSADRGQAPAALVAAEAPLRTRPSIYPPALAVRVAGRQKRPLGDLFGLTNFGVNLTRLAPGAASALRHAHTRQDELVYVIEGRPTLFTDAGAVEMEPGMCAGFKAGDGNGHHLVNRTQADVVYLEIGDRTAGDEATYPDDDIHVAAAPNGQYIVRHKDGTPY